MGKKASLLTYNTQRKHFDSVYERNKFYRGLFGYRQTVKRNGKKYEYEKDGVMDEVPNIRIDNSVFIVAKSGVSRLEDYFAEWKNKVEHRFFTVIVEDPELLQKMEWENDTKGEF